MSYDEEHWEKRWAYYWDRMFAIQRWVPYIVLGLVVGWMVYCTVARGLLR